MWAHLEWFCEHAGLIRIYKDDQKYGDPYSRAIAFVVIDRFETGPKIGNLELKGVTKVLTKDEYRAIRLACFTDGWGVLATKYKNGKVFRIELSKKYWCIEDKENDHS
jgi:hypothetical protein